MTEREPGGDAFERYAQQARERVAVWGEALTAFPGQLWSEWRIFLADWRAKQAVAAEASPTAAGGDDDRPVVQQLELEGLESQRGVPQLAGATTIVAERDDDASSIVGRIDAASEVEVLLVVPRRARLMRDAMAWPHIAAHVRQRGIALRVLASRRDVRQRAQDAGLPAARTVRGLRPRAALRLPLGAREVALPLPPLGPVLRFGAFVVVVVAVVGGVAFYVPSADIVVAPPAEPLTRSAQVRLNPVAETDLGLGIVAAGSVRETIVAVVSTATTGTATVGDVAATVVLEFTNDGQSDITLPIGTPVDDEGGFTFTTDEATTVTAGGTASVRATSIRPGTGGNLEADALRLLIGFPPTLTVTNLEPAEGGTDTEVPAAGAEDIVRVGQIAEEVLRQAGERELLRTISDGTVFTETVSVSILSQEPLVQIGEPAEAFLMEYTAVVSALVLTEAEARSAGEQLLVGALPDGMALLPGTTEATATATSYDGSRLVAELTATGLATPLIDPASLRGELTGVPPSTAAARLREQLALEEEPLIRVHPSWLPDWRMPQREGRISIALVSADALAAEVAGLPADADDSEQPDDATVEEPAGE